MKDHFPQWEPFLETYFLTCLLHDIGTTDANLQGTRMSFEYYGAFIAIQFLKSVGASSDQAEAVGEAIVRHADIGKTGNLTSLGQLIQLSTLFGKFSDTHHFLFPDLVFLLPVHRFEKPAPVTCIAQATIRKHEDNCGHDDKFAAWQICALRIISMSQSRLPLGYPHWANLNAATRAPLGRRFRFRSNIKRPRPRHSLPQHH